MYCIYNIICLKFLLSISSYPMVFMVLVSCKSRLLVYDILLICLHIEYYVVLMLKKNTQ